MRPLVRKLLLKVHPDVVGSVSEKHRAHNETALKTLMAYLEGSSADGINNSNNRGGTGSTKVFFYLRDGGRTSTVSLDSLVSPDKAVRELLGLSASEGADSEAEGRTAATATATTIDLKAPWSKDEFARVFRESMQSWWTQRDFLVNELERLFKQGRIRFAPDALDVTGDPEDDIDTRRAVMLAKEALEYFVEDSTLMALNSRFCKDIELVVVGRNLEEAVRSEDGRTLFVPMDMEPEDVGKEIDSIVDDFVERAMQQQRQQTADRKHRGNS